MDPRYAFGRSPSGGHYSPVAPATPSSPNYIANPLFTTPPVTPVQQQWGNPFPSSPGHQKVTSVASLGLMRPATPPVSKQQAFSVPPTPPAHHPMFSPPAGGVALPFPPAGGVQLPFPPPQPLPPSPQPVFCPSFVPAPPLSGQGMIPPPPPPPLPGPGMVLPPRLPGPGMVPPPPGFGMPLPPGPGMPPPPPPPLAGMTGMPSWKDQQKQQKMNPEDEAMNNMPAALQGTMSSKNKKPFTYTPGGIDLSEIRSPRMHRRLLAHQQSMHDETNNNTIQAEVHAPPKPLRSSNIEGGLDVGRSPEPFYPTGPRNLRSPDEPFRQSQSFRLLQKMTDTNQQDEHGGDVRGGSARREEDEMRFSGLRQPQTIPSRAFNTLQQITSTSPPPPPNYYGGPENGNEGEGGPVDIRYMGGNIPSRSFKMLQEMTGISDDEAQSPPPMMHAVQKPRRVVRTQMNMTPCVVPAHQSCAQKQFPQPEVPASQQQLEAEPKKYSGGRIPSQSFRILQAMTGEEDDGGTDF